MPSAASPDVAVPAFDGPLRLLVEQLWAAPAASPAVRLVLGGRTAPGWSVAESYRVVPSVERASLLLPAGPRPALTGALLNYRGLRRPRQNLQRTVLGNGARIGLPLPFPVLTIRTRIDVSAADRPRLPLETLREALGDRLDGDDLYASVGVRTGANRKATLQLVDADGSPQGFAKVAWDGSSRSSILAEQAALDARPGGHGARAPRIIARGELNGWPYLVAEPLPASARGVRADVPPPSAQELFGLCPLGRHAPIGDTAQFRGVRDRLARLSGSGPRDLVQAALALAQEVAAAETALPTTTRCHGDLTPWNSARDATGTLWCWDWESSEEDAVAGLDPLHWHASVGMERGERLGGGGLEKALTGASPMLVAAGTPRGAWGQVAAAYAVTIAERACTLGSGAGGWEAGWLTPGDVHELLRSARRLMSAS